MQKGQPRATFTGHAGPAALNSALSFTERLRHGYCFLEALQSDVRLRPSNTRWVVLFWVLLQMNPAQLAIQRCSCSFGLLCQGRLIPACSATASFCGECMTSRAVLWVILLWALLQTKAAQLSVQNCSCSFNLLGQDRLIPACSATTFHCGGHIARQAVPD